jgi:hypothetical protein
MRWLKRDRAAAPAIGPFPADMLQRMDLFGRFELDRFDSGINSNEIWPHCVAPFYDFATADPDGFLMALRSVVHGHEGGFATYGAARLVWELLGQDGIRRATALPLIDAGIDFKIERGLPGLHFTPYEMRRIAERSRP